jgi:hypothetical protein
MVFENNTPNFSRKEVLEKYSSAFTLSDMEIFVFPDLLFPLVIANIMSPILWKWKDDPWFKDIQKKNFNYKVNRIKQYIIDNYTFNLDLETWGLTTKTKEIDRFKDFLNMEILSQSNALFGYEGDKYYFDIDIRKHFGLDKYTTEVIPYWKTETLEAMTAFRFKEGYTTGAGECVSFSALYAAALFVVGQIPLDKIFMIGTPLHSQNFVDINEGVITNNRRIVTKNMWFNGTALSTRARRAIVNEKITIVSHLSGYIHYVYDTATIDKEAYEHFSGSLQKFLIANLTPALFINFLRYHMCYKKCFQYKHVINNRVQYIPMETIFEYEHSSRITFSDTHKEALIQEIDTEEFSFTPLESRIVIQDVEEYIEQNKHKDIEAIRDFFLEKSKVCSCSNEENINKLCDELTAFLKVHPRLPDINKQFEGRKTLDIRIEMSREEIIQMVNESSAENETALLSLYAYRQMDKIDWYPFIRAAVERNPVSLDDLKNLKAGEVLDILNSMPEESVYDGNRLALPDELWNFKRGDGVEKALFMANYLVNIQNITGIRLSVNGQNVVLNARGTVYNFTSNKDLIKEVEF